MRSSFNHPTLLLAVAAVGICGVLLADFGPAPRGVAGIGVANAHVDPQLEARQVEERLERSDHHSDHHSNHHSDKNADELHLRRGILHAKSQHWSKAIEAFDQALDHAPTLHEARLRKAGALLDGGCYEQAKLEAEAFLADRPDHPQALITWARAADRVGETREALLALDSALAQLERPSPSIFLERSRMVLRADPADIDRALLGIEEGMRRVGHVSTLMLEAVALERRAGRARQALGRLRSLIERSGAHPRWMLLEGELLEEAGQPANARIAYERALTWMAKLPASRRSTDAMQTLRTSIFERLRRLSQHSQAGSP